MVCKDISTLQTNTPQVEFNCVAESIPFSAVICLYEYYSEIQKLITAKNRISESGLALFDTVNIFLYPW